MQMYLLFNFAFKELKYQLSSSEKGEMWPHMFTFSPASVETLSRGTLHTHQGWLQTVEINSAASLKESVQQSRASLCLGED